MEIFLFPQKEACLCQNTQQLAGYGNGAKEFPLPRLLKHTWTHLKAQTEYEDEQCGDSLGCHSELSHSPCFIDMKKQR